MKNPWLAKNPFLSMWLSAGNSVLGAARGHALNQVRRQQAAAMNEGARAVLAFLVRRRVFAKKRAEAARQVALTRLSPIAGDGVSVRTMGEAHCRR